jgi:hypothetical protein
MKFKGNMMNKDFFDKLLSSDAVNQLARMGLTEEPDDPLEELPRVPIRRVKELAKKMRKNSSVKYNEALNLICKHIGYEGGYLHFLEVQKGGMYTHDQAFIEIRKKRQNLNTRQPGHVPK